MSKIHEIFLKVKQWRIFGKKYSWDNSTQVTWDNVSERTFDQTAEIIN